MSLHASLLTTNYSATWQYEQLILHHKVTYSGLLKVPTAMDVKIPAFFDVTTCSLTETFLCLGGTYCKLIQGRI